MLLKLSQNYKKDGTTPLIVFPHGGPWARDYWEFNEEVQYFTSRGFAVLRINFRGSTGFGKKHVLAGVDNLDKVMINDIADATLYALKSFRSIEIKQPFMDTAMADMPHI